jgi:transcriptional regulator with XRE-family HTH domain
MSDERPTAFPGFHALAVDVLVARLVERRQDLGLTQTEVAARMGTSQSAIARLEAGRSDLRMSTLERYAHAVDTTVEFTLGRGT